MNWKPNTLRRSFLGIQDKSHLLTKKRKNKPISYQQGTIISKHVLSPRVELVTIAPEEPFEWVPGQFIITKTAIDGEDKIADYTIISDPTLQDEFDLLVDNHVESQVGRLIHESNIEDKITFKAPRGRFMLNDTGDDFVFVWRDIGIAAGLPLLRQLVREKTDSRITILEFASEKFEPLFSHFANEFQDLQIKHQVFTSNELDAELIDTGNISKKQMTELFSQYTEGQFYISGSSAFVTKIRQKFMHIGADKSKITREVFG